MISSSVISLHRGTLFFSSSVMGCIVLGGDIDAGVLLPDGTLKWADIFDAEEGGVLSGDATLSLPTGKRSVVSVFATETSTFIAGPKMQLHAAAT